MTNMEKEKKYKLTIVTADSHVQVLELGKEHADQLGELFMSETSRISVPLGDGVVMVFNTRFIQQMTFMPLER